MPKPFILLKYLIGLLIPFLLVLGAVQVLVSDQYLEFDYSKYEHH